MKRNYEELERDEHFRVLQFCADNHNIAVRYEGNKIFLTFPPPDSKASLRTHRKAVMNILHDAIHNTDLWLSDAVINLIHPRINWEQFEPEDWKTWGDDPFYLWEREYSLDLYFEQETYLELGFDKALYQDFERDPEGQRYLAYYGKMVPMAARQPGAQLMLNIPYDRFAMLGFKMLR